MIAQAQNRNILSAQKADEFIDNLLALGIAADAESLTRIFPDVHRTAITYRLSSYDASYLELAMRRGVPLATLDDDLVKASRAAGVTLL